ncbi:hypothetical protein HJFPF1_11870 [Paramyrothecium foliicola]|nr:hypothetical protein HJFPF1_11870 [Paramyrothecium foliicola]
MSGAEAIFGIVAGGAGLLSLSIQLGESVIKLKKIYNAARDMPKNMSKIIFGLETIAIALRELEQQRQQSGHNGALLLRCIVQCQQDTAEIQHLVDEIESKLSRDTKFGKKFNVLLRDPEVQGLLNKLAAATNSLELAYMIYLGDQQRRLYHAQTQYHILQGTQLQALQSQVAAMDAKVIREIALLKEQSEAKQILPGDTAVSMRGTTNLETNTVSSVEYSKSSDLEHEQTDCHFSGFPKSKRKETRFRVRLRLPILICNSIWHLAIIRSQNSWTLHLQSYNIVPYYSKVFYHCRKGHLDEIRRMFASGEASPFDVYGYRDQTLLEEAAFHSQLDICRYLLGQAKPPDLGTTLHTALNLFVSESRNEDISREFYGLLTGQTDFHVDFEDVLRPKAQFTHVRWLFYCRDMDTLSLILHNAFPGFENLPIQSRFEMAIRLPLMGVSGFLRCIGLRASDSRLATISTSGGATALHWIADGMRCNLEWLPNFSRQRQEELRELGVEILRNGADPSSMKNLHQNPKTSGSLPTIEGVSNTGSLSDIYYVCGMTPLMACIGIMPGRAMWTLRSRIKKVSATLQAWVEMARDAQVDLCAYGRREKQIWEVTSIWNKSEYAPSTADLIFGPTPAHWGLKLTHTESVHLYGLQTPPGSYPRDRRLPTQIAWHPSSEEESEGNWSRIGRKDMYSTESNVRVYENPPDSDWFSPSFSILVDSTQDDAGIVALMQRDDSQRLVAAGRSCSQPPLLRRRECDYYATQHSQTKHWLGAHHLCPFDSQWRFNCILAGWEDLRDVNRYDVFNDDGNSTIAPRNSAAAYKFYTSPVCTGVRPRLTKPDGIYYALGAASLEIVQFYGSCHDSMFIDLASRPA